MRTTSFLAVGLVAVIVVACSDTVPVPELDKQRIDVTNIAGSAIIDVSDRLGEPSATRSFGQHVEWSYAIRAFQSGQGLRRAAVLRIVFGGGAVSEWYFVDRSTTARLPMSETLAAARRYLKRLCGQPIKEVDLWAGIVPGRTSQRDVTSLFEPVMRYTHRREQSTPSAIVWDFDVDRPSPLFIPPFYLKVVFQSRHAGPGILVSHVYPDGYGECR